MVRFTRPGHIANHVGKSAATNPKLQAQPVERGLASGLLARRDDGDLSLRTESAARSGFPFDGRDNSLRRSR
jgi:hypothetical protein